MNVDRSFQSGLAIADSARPQRNLDTSFCAGADRDYLIRVEEVRASPAAWAGGRDRRRGGVIIAEPVSPAQPDGIADGAVLLPHALDSGALLICGMLERSGGTGEHGGANNVVAEKVERLRLPARPRETSADQDGVRCGPINWFDFAQPRRS